jgi:hypothetical protein
MEMMKMAKNDVVLVKILELPGVSGGCSCGSMLCTPEVAAMFQQKVDELRAALEEAYPSRTKVEHVNLKDHPAEKESEIGKIETIKATFSILSPVSGKVAEVNPEIDASPFLINQDPYGAG